MLYEVITIIIISFVKTGPKYQTRIYFTRGQEERIMVRKIRKAAVIGSGIMGGGIAALLAGAGVDVLLLDIVPFDLTDEEKKDPAASVITSYSIHYTKLYDTFF